MLFLFSFQVLTHASAQKGWKRTTTLKNEMGGKKNAKKKWKERKRRVIWMQNINSLCFVMDEINIYKGGKVLLDGVSCAREAK